MQRRFFLLGSVSLMLLPGIVLAQGTTGTGTFGGTIPTTYAISNASNGNLAGALGSFGTLTIGSTTAYNAPTPVAFRLRSNDIYKLTASVGSLVGITDGAASGETLAAQAIKTGDIGFGFTTAIVKTGVSVVGGGTTPTRSDTIVTGYDVTAGWPALTDGHTPAFLKTLHDIYAGVQILSGDRISSAGDNTSDDNYLTVTLGVATVPQYFTAASFSGTVTLTIAATS